MSVGKMEGLKLGSIGYKNIPVSIDDAPKAVQGERREERNLVTIISCQLSARAARNASDALENRFRR